MPQIAEDYPQRYSCFLLAERYGLSVQQAQRYIDRFGADRRSLDHLLSSRYRTAKHREDETNRSIEEVTYG